MELVRSHALNVSSLTLTNMIDVEMTSTETDSFSIIEGTSIKPPLIDNSVLCDSASLNSNKKYPSLTNEGNTDQHLQFIDDYE